MLSVPSGLVLPAKFRRPGRAAATALMLVALLAGCARGATAAIEVPVDPGVVQTKEGALRGTVAADHRFFAGIPYAAPPVGPLRWQPPAPVPSWTGFRDATRPGPRCIQDVSNDVDGRRTSEDCLTLNVWTPPPSDEPRPVMVWIHGGSFINGSGDIYNARRAGEPRRHRRRHHQLPAGCAGLPGAPGTGPGRRCRQLRPGRPAGGVALGARQHRRVRRRSRQGDHRGGVGGRHVGLRPPRRPRFGGLVQRGDHPKWAVPGAIRPAAAERASLQYAAEAGCGDPATAAQCLRALPPDKLQRALYYGRIGTEQLSGPVTGTKTLPVDPMTGAAEGRAARVPVMIGTTADEFNLFTALQYVRGRRDRCRPLSGAAVGGVRPGCRRGRAPLSAGALRRQCAAGIFGRRHRRCLRMRGRPDGGRAVRGRARLLVCVRRPRPRRHRSCCARRHFPSARAIRWSCAICSTWAERRPESRPARLSDQMMDYWSRFVATGSPGSDWPALTDGDAVGECRCNPAATASSPISTETTSARSGRA